MQARLHELQANPNPSPNPNLNPDPRRGCTSCTRGNIQLTPYVQAKLHELQAEERAARGGGLCGGGEGGGEGGGAGDGAGLGVGHVLMQALSLSAERRDQRLQRRARIYIYICVGFEPSI